MTSNLPLASGRGFLKNTQYDSQSSSWHGGRPIPHHPHLRQIGQTIQEVKKDSSTEETGSRRASRVQHKRSKILLKECPSALAGLSVISSVLKDSEQDADCLPVEVPSRESHIAFGIAFIHRRGRAIRTTKPVSYCAYIDGPASNRLRAVCLSSAVTSRADGPHAQRLDHGRQGRWDGGLGRATHLSSAGGDGDDHCE